MAVANPAATPWDFATAMKLGHYSWQNPDTKDQNLKHILVGGAKFVRQKLVSLQM